MFSLLYTTLITNDAINQTRRLSGLIIISLLTACANAPQTKQLINQWPQALPHHAELASVPFYAQKAYQCGPAALATILVNQSIKVAPNDLIDKVYIPERKGSLQIEMLATARQYGMIPYRLSPEIKAILSEVAAGQPVLVFQNLALTWAPQWHYAVVVGYDLETRSIILRSGIDKRHITDMRTFELTWLRAGSWSYVLTPPSLIPLTAEPEKYLHAVQSLYETGSKEKAYLAYKHAAEYWPESALSQMTLGNIEYEMKRYRNASRAFIDAIKLDNTNAYSWNNLAYSYSEQNCKNAAIEAIECAHKIAPEDENINSSYQDLIENSEGDKICVIPDCP